MTEAIQAAQTTAAPPVTVNAPVPAVDFEATLAELERIVEQLEGEVKLEEALSLFERGMKLSHICERFLKTAEQKIEVLKRAANGSLETTPYNADNDS